MVNNPKIASLGSWDINGTSLCGVAIAYLQGVVKHSLMSYLVGGSLENSYVLFIENIAFYFWTLI